MSTQAKHELTELGLALLSHYAMRGL